VVSAAGAGLTLYDLDHSPFAARVRIAVRAKGLAVTMVPPPGGVRSDAYRRINPLGLVPTLVTEDGTALPESDVIVEYLDERFPDVRLLPSDPDRRARCRLITRVADLYLAPALKALFEHTKKPADPVAFDGLIEAVRRHLGVIEGLLGDGSCAVGEALTAADCALAPLLFFAARCAPLAPDAPLFGAGLAVYWDAIRRQPSVAPVLAEMAASQVRRAAARARGEPED
jgi:glutathione S-transferase